MHRDSWLIKSLNQRNMESEPVLLFAYGNLSRGDDALAPLLLERLQQQGIVTGCGHQLKYLSDYQMQIEHVMDLQGCVRVLLFDAAVDITESYQFYPITVGLETHYTTHGMSPSTLLHTYRQTLKETPPPTSMLAIRGEDFELGQPLTNDATHNLNAAFEFLTELLSADDFSLWDASLNPS